MKPQEYKDVPFEIFECDLTPTAHSRFDYEYDRLMEKWARPPGWMLEIGCGMGHFINHAKHQGWNVIGCDPSEKVARWAMDKHNIEVIPKHYHELPSAVRYDVIVAIEVLEHTLEPVKFLQKAVSEMNSPGMLYLTVPNMNCTRIRQDSEKSEWHTWPGMAPWGHMQYFKPGVLMNMLQEVGFKRVEMIFQVGDHGDEQIVAVSHR